MTSRRLSPGGRLRGLIRLPGDKSIAHRAVILSALSNGPTTLSNVPVNDDCTATIAALKRLGIAITRPCRGCLHVIGKGLHGLRKPGSALDVCESGTTMRLLAGVLCGQPFESVLTGRPALLRRPMRRVAVPLRLMGAGVRGRPVSRGGKREEYPPLRMRPGNLAGITYALPVASAQVKSALLLAGLYASGRTKVIERLKTRDHTERMLSLFHAPVSVRGNAVTVTQAAALTSPRRLRIPGDISSAAFFIVAAAIVPDSDVRIDGVCLNPGRIGFINVLKRMGARIEIVRHADNAAFGAEPWGRIIVRSSALRGAVVGAREIPALIDELPVLMVAAACAEGETVFEGVGELRVKETDRIHAMRENLSCMGVATELRARAGKETLLVRGARRLRGSRIRSFHDHRIAMSMAVAALAAEGGTAIDDTRCVRKSFPEFFSILKSATRRDPT